MKVKFPYFQILWSIAFSVCVFLFSIALAAATFIENDFGSETARAVVYEAVWFQVLGFLILFVVPLTMILRHIRKREKWYSLLMYVGVILIFVGYAVTHRFGYFGRLHLRKGEVSKDMQSSKSYLQIDMQHDRDKIHSLKPCLFSSITPNRFHDTIQHRDQIIHVRCVKYIRNATFRILNDSQRTPVILIQIADRGNVKPVPLQVSESYSTQDAIIGFQAAFSDTIPTIQIQYKKEQLVLSATQPVTVQSMVDQTVRTVSPSTEIQFTPYTVYQLGSLKLGLVQFYPHGRIEAMPLSKSLGYPRHQDQMDALIVEIQIDDHMRRVSLFRDFNHRGNIRHIRMQDYAFDMVFGTKQITLPFTIQLKDFRIERYAGSQHPSDFISHVVLNDASRDKKITYPISMNHILKYRGYRFFQSSYDEDESGSIFSVSYDPGTPVFYSGCLLLVLSLLIQLFDKNGRFRQLGRKISRYSISNAFFLLGVIPLLFCILPVSVVAEVKVEKTLQFVRGIDYHHSRKFGRMLIQDQNGRVKPLNSRGHELMHGLSYPNRALGLHPDQMVLGMLVWPSRWQDIPMIRIDHPEINRLIGIGSDRKWMTYRECFDAHSDRFKLIREYDQARHKSQKQRTSLEKSIIRLQKRIAILEQALTENQYRIFPIPEDATLPWQSIQHNTLWMHYADVVKRALKENQWEEADKTLFSMIQVQRRNGKSLIPEQTRIRAEILYNEMNLLGRLAYWILIPGIFLMAVSIFRIYTDKPFLATFIKWIMILLVIAFVLHTFGLGLRWVVSGHAPWSNQYESMVYVAWALMLAGLVLSKKSAIPLASASLISGLILKVAHLPWVDPKITNLPPVLQSHWILTHVSVIVSSYGFFGLSAFLGFIVLLLFIVKTRRSAPKIEPTIALLTWINERSIVLGYLLVVIGTFLGAVWANESWGRYWGWDSKETWTLIVILIYTLITSLHFNPVLYSAFLFNVSTFLAFSTILMTYIGVNFYLSGLHSYATGNASPIPGFFYILIFLIVGIVGMAFPKRKLSTRDFQQDQ